MADGSDPMPLCRHKGCGPFKAVERSTVLQDGSDPMPICRGKRCF
jgi:hypothetical protein